MLRKFTVAALVLVFPAISLALTPKEILEKSDRARGKGPGLVWTINITTQEDEDVKEETVEVKARETDALVTFLAPARVKGQKMLLVGRNMWFIKPGVSKPIPISPRQKLMGQAANGDIASTNYAGDYDAKLVGEEKVGEELCYVLDLTAKSANLTYDRIMYWVSKAQLVGVKADFYTVSGKKFKTATLESRNSINVGGEKYPFVSRMTINDAIRINEKTILDFSAIRIREVPDSTFNLNLLAK